jgi:hypothetical protein
MVNIGIYCHNSNEYENGQFKIPSATAAMTTPLRVGLLQILRQDKMGIIVTVLTTSKIRAVRDNCTAAG